MIDPSGTFAVNNSDSTGAPYYGWRTPIQGLMSFDTITGAGTGTMVPFSFFGGRLSSATNISFQTIGDGAGGPGSLLLANMSFNWGVSKNPVSLVLDASGLFAAVGDGVMTSDMITGGVLPATDDFRFSNGKSQYTLPLGSVPIATTTFNTKDIGAVGFDSNPSGTLPLTDDGIGGSPIRSGAFPGFHANFDFAALHVYQELFPVPVPAALWLFGSGLAGLVGLAMHRRTGA